MNKKSSLYGLIGLLVGIVITGFVAGQSVNNNYSGMMKMIGIDASNIQRVASDHSSMSMADMSKQLEGLTGDEYDKAFIEMMIAHHQGAVDMAKLSVTRAKHDEIKQLSKDIIVAQQEEIADMKQWQNLWGYSGNEMMHGGY